MAPCDNAWRRIQRECRSGIRYRSVWSNGQTLTAPMPSKDRTAVYAIRTHERCGRATPTHTSRGHLPDFCILFEAEVIRDYAHRNCYKNINDRRYGSYREVSSAKTLFAVFHIFSHRVQNGISHTEICRAETSFSATLVQR